MKKINILICLALLFGMAGCDSSDEESESDTTSTATQETTAAEEESSQEFDNIDIDMSQGSIKIYSGDNFSLLYENGGTAEYTVSDNTLYISNQAKGDIVLTLPDDDTYETVTISIDQGNIYTSPYLDINNLSVDLQEGEVTLDNLSVSEITNVNVKKGTIFLEGTFGGDVNISCSEAHISLISASEESSFNYDLTISSADITIGSRSYQSNQSIDNGASKTMTLSCTQGDIEIEFK